MKTIRLIFLPVKNALFIFLLLISVSVIYPALADEPVQWPSSGSEWYYEVVPWMGCFPNCYYSFQRLYVAGDTVINSKDCVVLIRENHFSSLCDDNGNGREYIYSENKKVFWYNRTIEDFTILYDFNAEKGDSWEIQVHDCSFNVRVDSVSTEMIGEQLLKVLFVSDEDDSHQYFNGKIIENIGHTGNMFPREIFWRCQEFACDSDFINSLRCYMEDDQLIYSQGERTCDSVVKLNVSTDIERVSEITIFPNPVTDRFKVQFNDGVQKEILVTGFSIYDHTGRKVKTGVFSESKIIDLSDFPGGVYFLIVYRNGVQANAQKIIKL